MGLGENRSLDEGGDDTDGERQLVREEHDARDQVCATCQETREKEPGADLWQLRQQLQRVKH